MAAKYGYIGNSPENSSVIVARQTFSPTGVTTTFTFASGYVIGYLDAYLNGSRLIEGQDYTASNGSSVDLISAAGNGDILELVAYKAFNAATIDTAPGNLTVQGKLTVTGATSAATAVYTGIVTASSFSGNVTGNATGLSGTPNVIVGIITATEFDVSGSTNTLNANGLNVGIATATTLKVGTGVTISSGVVTATEFDISGTTNTFNSSGVNVVGVVTATSFVGSGANLTGTTGKAIAMAIVFA